jgi:hypothetical protein
VDPGGAAALVALLTNGGPWAVVVVVLTLVLRVWRSGEFISKSVHDTIVAATTQRYTDLLDRFNNQQEAIKLWRENSSRATAAAEAAAAQHAEVLARLAALAAEVEEFRDDFRAARAWRELGPPPGDGRPDPGSGRRGRPDPREGG